MSNTCSKCSVRFTLMERRHHCRMCGGLFCNKCTRFRTPLPRLKMYSPVRVCEECHGKATTPTSSEWVRQEK